MHVSKSKGTSSIHITDHPITGKTILIISPQPWGKMKVSKHHYALELAKMGNSVYFLEHQLKPKIKKIFFIFCEDHPNITIVKYPHLGPYPLKFHARSLFHYFMRFRARQIAQKIDRPIDIVWDFDCNFSFARLDDFGAKVNIFHPVDHGASGPSNKNPDCVFSVSPFILENYSNIKAPAFFINHGLPVIFEKLAKEELNHTEEKNYAPDTQFNIGYVGNIKHYAIDRKILKKIITTHSNHIFHFFGPFQLSATEKDPDLIQFIDFLNTQENCRLYGICTQQEIADHSKSMDLFLACYRKTGKYLADNSHKILEYLSTGKVVVSNYLSVYEQEQVLQIPSDYSNEGLPDLFAKTLESLPFHNSYKERKKRLEYALKHTYYQQIRRIAKILNQIKR